MVDTEAVTTLYRRITKRITIVNTRIVSNGKACNIMSRTLEAGLRLKPMQIADHNDPVW